MFVTKCELALIYAIEVLKYWESDTSKSKDFYNSKGHYICKGKIIKSDQVSTNLWSCRVVCVCVYFINDPPAQ